MIFLKIFKSLVNFIIFIRGSRSNSNRSSKEPEHNLRENNMNFMDGEWVQGSLIKN